MVPPSYARATTSSRLKTNSPASPSHEPSTASPTTPKKKLNRPSTLTPSQRKSISYKSDLYPIKPHDPTKPCLLATLPSELRTSIYQHILNDITTIPRPHQVLNTRLRKLCYVWPRVLHICQAIRIEAAYVYYTHTPFLFNILNLNFGQTRWLDMLPRRHRELLAHNQNLTLNVDLQLRHAYTYAPKDWLLDASLKKHWDVCAPWGNLYDLEGQAHRIHFVMFCRLMNWWKYDSSRMMRDVKWRYSFEIGSLRGSSWPWLDQTPAERLLEFLKDRVRVLEMRCVGKAWTRGREVGGLKEGAGQFLNALDEAFGRVSEVCTEEVSVGWHTVMRRLRVVVEKW